MLGILGYTFAAIVLTAGFWDYYISKSFTLLAVDLVCGGALVYGAALRSEDPNNYVLQLVPSIIVAVTMACRYFNSNRWLPSLVVTVLSCMMIIQIGYFLVIRSIIQAFAEILNFDDEGLQPG